MGVRQNTLETEARQLLLLVPFLAHGWKWASRAQLAYLVLADFKSMRLLVDPEQRFEILACHQPMKIILLLETEPFKYALVASRGVAGFTRQHEIIGGIVPTSVLGDKVIRGQVLR